LSWLFLTVGYNWNCPGTLFSRSPWSKTLGLPLKRISVILSQTSTSGVDSHIAICGCLSSSKLLSRKLLTRALQIYIVSKTTALSLALRVMSKCSSSSCCCSSSCSCSCSSCSSSSSSSSSSSNSRCLMKVRIFKPPINQL